MTVVVLNKFRQILFLVLLLVLFSCGNSGSQSNNEIKPPDQFPAFDNFPDSLFYGINFRQSIQETEQELIALDFELNDSSGSKYFVCKKDSTEFILPDINKLSSFKIFVYSQTYLNHKEDLLNRFKTNSVSNNLSDEFSVFQYELDSVDFKLSVFAQEEYLRLSFEERLSK